MCICWYWYCIHLINARNMDHIKTQQFICEYSVFSVSVTLFDHTRTRCLLQRCLPMPRETLFHPITRTLRIGWEMLNHQTPALREAICWECRFVCGCEIIGRGLFKVHYFIPLRKHRKSINLKCTYVDLEDSYWLKSAVPLICSKRYL